MTRGKSLPDFLEDINQPELTRLLLSVAEAGKVIARLVNNAGISDILGSTGVTNVQGETVLKLDDFSNNLLMDYLRDSKVCAGYLSEENDDIVTLCENGLYTIAIDPLDGSSNIDIAAPIGTIFAVNKRLSPAGPVNAADFLQKGNAVVCSGYIIFGSSTVMVFSTGSGVNGFTLDTENHEFYLSHPDLKLPAKGKIYSVNQGNCSKFEDGLNEFLRWCATPDKETSRPYSQRYIGSMVGDMHRTLLKGGIFIYPANKGEQKGKLRLLYECIPMAFLIEQCGGIATDGRERILDIQPVEVHERSAIYIGNANLVQKAISFISTLKEVK